MTSPEFWAALRAHGFTYMTEVNAGQKRRVILQSRSKLHPSITHPDDLTAKQRLAELRKFERTHML